MSSVNSIAISNLLASERLTCTLYDYMQNIKHAMHSQTNYFLLPFMHLLETRLMCNCKCSQYCIWEEDYQSIKVLTAW